jgi:Spy/CpxP family protein refolding chaperone
MAAALGLTDQQKAEIKQMRAEMKEDTAPIRKQLKERRQELHKLWSADRPSAKKIIAKHAEMDPLRAEMRAYRVRLRIAMRDVLTADQLKRWKELKGKRKGRRGRGRGMMGPGGMTGPEGGPVGWCGVNADPRD